MIVGTAGHIDHGKTTLVRALTGVDTDRLPEEKARGISIELGYAYVPLDNGEVLGFVDVPGHERFVHTMLSGATGIDFALLVVAADDGVMPQTREHLNILLLLGIEAGAIVLTKIDTVEAARVAAVDQELRALAVRTPFADGPIFAVSGRTFAGVEPLRRYLAGCAMQHHRRTNDAHFRLAVDRSFTLPGIGTVVTGTVHSGEVRVGANMVVAPSGREVRVRSIHAQNRSAEVGMSGQRCALNLAGIARHQVKRGDWVVAPSIALATERFDARLTVLAGETKPLRSGTLVHVHLGAAHIPGRVVVLDAGADDAARSDQVAPATELLVQIVLQGRIAAWHGDRFVIRDASATRTIGGGRVLDPFAPTRYRRSPERLAVLAALDASTPGARLALLVEQAPYGVDLVRLARANNMRDLDRLTSPLAARRIASGGVDFLIDGIRWHSLQLRVKETLAAFHQTHPDELGPDNARLKRIAFPRFDDALYRALIADLLAAGDIRQSGPWMHLPTHNNAPSPQERALIEKILPRLLDAPFEPPWVRELAKDAAQPEALVRATLIHASKRGETFQVVRDLFYHRIAIRDLAAAANNLYKLDGEVCAAAFRDRTGLGRKRAIQILEFFDRVGFTRRVHDKHLVRADNLLALDVPAIGSSSAARTPSADEHRAI